MKRAALALAFFGLLFQFAFAQIGMPWPGGKGSSSFPTLTVTDIGHNNGTGSTVSITVPAGGVPIGALVVVAFQSVMASGGTFTDTGGNTYSVLTQTNMPGANGFGGIAYSQITTALVSGNTINFTNSTTFGAVSALYVSNANASPFDASATATTSGSTGSCSVTSGTPASASEMFIAFCGFRGNNGFTLDTGNGWTTPFDADGNGPTTNGRALGGGHQLNAGTGTLTSAPTITSNDWVAVVVAVRHQ